MVYVDDIVSIGNDHTKISETVPLESPSDQRSWEFKYFLGIEVVQSKKGIVISRSMYALDILKEIRMLDCRSVIVL